VDAQGDTMTAGGWERVKVAFEVARTMNGAGRQEYLLALSSSDPEIVEDLRGLLAAYNESASFLATEGMQHAIQSDLEAGGLTLTGQRLGAWQVAQLIGVGGMGEVYRGERADGEFQQRVAIKVVRGATDPFSIARFRNERQILANLSHPNIARLYDGGTTNRGEPYLVMEYIEGQRIDDYCRSRKLANAECLRLIETVCGAVEYAHRHNIIHRDIKPANIMVGEDGAPRLLDFGIARLMEAPDGGRTATATQARALTPDYASPEQLVNRPLTAASDVFSLGAVLHELLTGVRFRPDPARAKDPGRRIAPEYARIVAKATAADPAERYSSAAEMSVAIHRALTRAPSVAWLAAIAAGVLMVLFAGFLLWRWRFGPQAGGGSIAVIEIENLSQDPSLDWMDRGISELLTTGLAQSEKFEVISTERIRNLMGRRVKGDDRLPAALVRDVAAEAQAKSFVSGALMRVGQRLRLDVKVQDTASGRVLFAHRVDGEDAQSVFQMADETAGLVVRQIGGSSGKKPASGQGLTENVEALKAYSEGMRFTDRFLMDRAVRSFRTAIQLDPRFAMAHYRIAETIAFWNWKDCRDQTQQAASMGESLTLPRSQMLKIRILNMTCSGQFAEAQSAARSLTSESPHDAEAWNELSVASYYVGDLPEAYAALERGLAIDPNSVPLMEDGWWLSAYTGDFARMMQFTKRYQATLEPGDVNGLDFVGDGYSIFGRLDEAMAAYRQENRYDKMAFICLRQGNYDRAEALLRRDLDGLPPNGPARGGRTGFLGDVEVARGNPDRALPFFEEGARLYGRQYWFSADVMLKGAQVYLEQGAPAKLLDLADHQTNPWRSGFRGMAGLLIGKPAQAEVDFTALRTSVSQIMGATMADQYEKLYRGMAALYGPKPADAIEPLSGLPSPYHLHTALPLGRAYLQRGDLAAAERELNFALKAQSIWGMPVWYERQSMLVLLLAHYYLGELSEKLGRRADAVAHYREFYGHFEHSKARLPQIAGAKVALARLAGASGGEKN
jgi:TolB-like protein/tetratricopeptide (TPR) repeat protein/predicted Ser/Thr protein kinase